MNLGQQKFYHYILERVKDGKQLEAKRLLAQTFAAQSEGPLQPQSMAAFSAKILSLLKEDYIEEVKSIMENYTLN